MKYCSRCQTAYTDDTLKFCLQDGAPLIDAPDANFEPPTVAFDDSETIVSRKPPQQVVRIDVPETEPENLRPTDFQPGNQERAESSPDFAPPSEAKKSNTTSIVLTTILGMCAVFGIIGAGAWFLLKSRKTEITAANVNTAVNTKPANRTPNINSANVQTTNVNAAAAAPTAPPIPKATLKPEEIKASTKDVEQAINEWKDASENLDIDGNLNHYAETIDYYAAGRVSRTRVRADKQRAFEQYDTINFDLSNVKITPDASGDKATAIFDKEWRFEGAEAFSAGKVRQQLTLGKIGGRWLITGEKDLKTYYVEK